MKNARESNDALLNAVLADEDWQELNCSLKREALAAIGSQRRRRRFRFWTGRLACATLVLAGTLWWLRPPPPAPAPIAGRPGYNSPPFGAEARFLSEDEMLKLFPPGSCVVAEVNGQKQLVFFDAKKAEHGFVLGGQ
ncbi:MAG TPA: hypothetical protein VJW76_06810 [Verrucomicrobiae bacterium]|nr:hypothetical protein [Verrucomicrobiae bacterium]